MVGCASTRQAEVYQEDSHLSLPHHSARACTLPHSQDHPPKMLYKSITSATILLACASAAQIDVDVGEDGLVFDPSTVTAAAGDTVAFHFYPRDHSVVQSTFDSPCKPMSGGFYSGYIPSTSGEAKSVFVVTVNNTDPIWFYCSQGSHCQDGMVGVINPP